MREFRKWLVHAGISFIKQEAPNFARKNSKQKLITASLVSDKLKCDADELDGLSLKTIKDTFIHQLTRSGLGHCVVLGGIDFSYNIEGKILWPEHWQPHIYALVLGVSGKVFRENLAKFYPYADCILRPIVTKKVVSLPRPTSYILKSRFWKRSSYTSLLGKPATRIQTLKSINAAELAVYLDQTYIQDRLILRNIRRNGIELVRTT